MTTNHFNWLAMLFMAALSINFVACSSDDDLSLSDEHQSALDGAWQLTHYKSEWHWTDGDGEGSKEDDRDNEMIIFKSSTQKVITAGYDPEKSDKSWSVSSPKTYTYDSAKNTLYLGNGRSYVVSSVSKSKLVLRKEDVEDENNYRYDIYTYKKVTDPEAVLGKKIDFGDKDVESEEMKQVLQNIKENRMLLAYWYNEIEDCPNFVLYSDGTTDKYGKWTYDRSNNILSFTSGMTLMITSLTNNMMVAKLASVNGSPTYTWTPRMDFDYIDPNSDLLLYGTWRRDDGSLLVLDENRFEFKPANSGVSMQGKYYNAVLSFGKYYNENVEKVETTSSYYDGYLYREGSPILAVGMNEGSFNDLTCWEYNGEKHYYESQSLVVYTGRFLRFEKYKEKVLLSNDSTTWVKHGNSKGSSYYYYYRHNGYWKKEYYEYPIYEQWEYGKSELGGSYTFQE